MRSRSTCPRRASHKEGSDAEVPRHRLLHDRRAEGPAQGGRDRPAQGGRRRRQAHGRSSRGVLLRVGDNDVVTIVDVPDGVTAAALAIGISSTGTVGTRTTVLLTPEEIDQATKKTLAFRAAGQ